MKTPRDYQTDTINSILNAKDSRALVVLASGLGKTVIAAIVARLWRSVHKTKVLFLVHMNEAVEQAQSAFLEEFVDRKETVAVLRRSRGRVQTDIVFSTFQTMHNHLDEFAPGAFGLVIVDEAHHGQAVTYRDVIRYFTPNFLFGMTATPDRMDGQDIRDIFGQEVYKYGLAEALAEGKWLAKVDYRVMFDNIDIRKLEELVKRAHGGDRTVTRETIDSTIFLPERLEEIAKIVKREGKSGKKKTIIFCRSLNHLNLVRQFFPDAKPYHSRLPLRELHERLDDFRNGKLRTILVVNKFNEAIDIPDAELLVFLRSTDSEIVWKQQLGRGCRLSPGKKQTVVLDFVVNCKRYFMIRQFASEIGDIGKREQLLVQLGLGVNFVERTVDLAELLQFLDRNFYETWLEAALAARKLKIKTCEEYRRRYREDPRLPSIPDYSYASVWEKNGKWRGFLDNDFYTTWEEASAAVQRLGIKTCTEYRTRRLEDERLHSNPELYYHKAWKAKGGWKGFLGTRRYPTWEEAKKAARRLKVSGCVAYKSGAYKLDPLLPSDPSVTYRRVWKERGGWPGFLGKTKHRRK